MTDRKTIEIYQARAADYAGLAVSESQAEALAAFLALLPAGGHILDLGCGPGLHAAQMQRAGFSVDAIDATPAFVEAARANGVPARLASFDDIDAENLYDAVWASFSLLHAPKSAIPTHLAALRRALKPGGILFLGMKLGEGEHRDSLGRRYSYFKENDLMDLIRASGLHPVNAMTGEERGLDGSLAPYILILAHG